MHLHRIALKKLRLEPELRLRALALVERWLVTPGLEGSRPWLEEWRNMLRDWPMDRVELVVLDEEGGQVLRQCSPLAPVLSPRERWAALKEINRRLGPAGGRRGA